MRKFNLISISLGGEPKTPFMDHHPQLTGEYFDGLTKVGEEVVPYPMGLALCDPWFEGDEHPTFGDKTARVKAAWPVDYGRARTLEGRMKKALSQYSEQHV